MFHKVKGSQYRQFRNNFVYHFYSVCETLFHGPAMYHLHWQTDGRQTLFDQKSSVELKNLEVKYLNYNFNIIWSLYKFSKWLRLVEWINIWWLYHPYFLKLELIKIKTYKLWIFLFYFIFFLWMSTSILCQATFFWNHC